MYGLCFSAVFRILPESVTYHAGAIVFNGAFVDLMPTVLQGATYVLAPKFDPVDFIETVATEHVTHVSMVPSQLISLLYAPNFSPEKLKSLEMVLVMGAPLHQRHKEELEKHLPGRFHELYGNTEGVITVLDKTDFKAKPNSVGTPTPFFKIKILDEENNEAPAGTMGEICGTSPLHMKGYYKRPDLTSQTVIDGLIHTGDMGYKDEDGYLYLVDRKKDMIVSGGVNVYPRDIEEVAIKHPAIQEVAVFGIQDEKWGETPVAGVRLSQGESLSPQELKEWINQRVGAKYQRISRVIILEDFPRNVAGKVLKRELRETCQNAVE
jgi:acyl-CoA synthetase (AMP-forming)/AMP-acid ligase II